MSQKDCNTCKYKEVPDLFPPCCDCNNHSNYEKIRDEKINDVINRPAHYTDGKIEVIDFIEDKKLGFCLGNAVKYIARAGKKDPTKEVEDLKKAEWYIKRRIKELEEVYK